MKQFALSAQAMQLLRKKIEAIVVAHPTWTKEEVKTELLRTAKSTVKKQSRYTLDLPRALTPAEKAVDFSALQTGLDRLEAQSQARIRTILVAARDKLIALISRKLQEQTLTTAFINGLELRGLGQLIPTLREILGAAFRLGSQEAKAEIKRHKTHTFRVQHTLEGLPPEKALEFFEQKATIWGADIRDTLLNDVKDDLYDAIKRGSALREIQSTLEATFLPWLGDPTQQVDEELLTPYRLETVVRTNIIEALNEGRKAQWEPEVESGYITALQFSAILDKRTTEVCRYLDKKMFKPNSPELDRLTPPRNYNCRSILVPWTRDQGPVVFILPTEVAKGVELSGEGFCQEGEVHS